MTEPRDELAATCAELQRLQRQRSTVIKSRLMQANRLQSVVAGSLGYSSGMAEKDRKKKFAEASARIAAVAARPDSDALTGVDAIVRTTLVGLCAFERLLASLELPMRHAARTLPAIGWVRGPERRGFGELFLAIVAGETGDLRDYANPAKVWRRLGCAPHSFGGKTLMGATWKSGREGKLPAGEWEAFGYSPRRRSIAFLIGEGIVKQNFVREGAGDAGNETEGARAGPYRARYDEAKARLRELHPDEKAYPDLRCHRHGMLLATKMLLRDLWAEWNGNPPAPAFPARTLAATSK